MIEWLDINTVLKFWCLSAVFYFLFELLTFLSVSIFQSSLTYALYYFLHGTFFECIILQFFVYFHLFQNCFTSLFSNLKNDVLLLCFNIRRCGYLPSNLYRICINWHRHCRFRYVGWRLKSATGSVPGDAWILLSQSNISVWVFSTNPESKEPINTSYHNTPST